MHLLKSLLIYSQVSFNSSIPKRESLVYFESRGVPTTASIAILTERTSPHSFHFFRALLRASRDIEIVERAGERETWNTRNTGLEINETWDKQEW